MLDVAGEASKDFVGQLKKAFALGWQRSRGGARITV